MACEKVFFQNLADLFSKRVRHDKTKYIQSRNLKICKLDLFKVQAQGNRQNYIQQGYVHGAKIIFYNKKKIFLKKIRYQFNQFSHLS